MPYPSIILHALVLGIFLALYWKAGQIENPSSNSLALFWSTLSLLLFLLTWYFLDLGLLLLILSQLALALLIALLRALPSLLHSDKSP